MTLSGKRFSVLAAMVCVALGVTVVVPASATDYPTWDQIEAARGSEAATATTVSQLESLLDDLQTDAARLGDAAVARAAESEAAQASLDGARSVERSLTKRADAAARKSARSTAQAAQIAAALYRSGGTDLAGTLLMTSESNSSALLYRLGALGKVSEQLELAIQQAQTDLNLATALTNQAELARLERERLASAAAAALASATEAESNANTAVATQQTNLTLIYEQLAALKNTTVYLEQQYRIGRDAADSGGAGSGTGSGGSNGGSGSSGEGGNAGGFSVPGNEVNNVAAAQHFAMVQLAGMGFGPDNGNCLIWLWSRESGWRTNAYNSSSGAYGIPQSLPGSKMANYAADWRTNYETQIMWGLIYISGRYGSPCAAWGHSEAVGWY